MNNDMKCPICGQELKNINFVWFCENESCRAYDWTMEEAAWQELIRTHKALEQSEICCTEWEKQALDYKAENIALSGDLERTSKALDVATGFIKGISQTVINDCDNQYVVLGNFKKFAQDALNQIKTALEQKDK